MNREELLAEIRKIEITSRNSSRYSMSGNYRSVLRGSGMEISGFKEYSPDDDYRSVDWNVSARSGKIYSRIYQEERDNPVFFIIDTSQSMYTGGLYNGKRKTKIEAAAVAVASIAFSAVFNNDKAGSVFCSDTVEDEKRIGGKTAHIADMVFSLLDHVPEKPVFDITYALSCIPSSVKKGCCFIISDFKSPLPEGMMHAAGRKTDLVFIRITDPSDSFREGSFSFSAGNVDTAYSYPHKVVRKTAVRDESGRRAGRSGGKRRGECYFRLTGNNRIKLEQEALHFLDRQKSLIIREGISLLDISTEDNILPAVNNFFLRRRIS